MRVRTALMVAAAIIVVMFVFDWAMMNEVNHWADQIVELSITQRLLISFAFVLHRIKWIAAPGIVGLFLVISMITERSAPGTSTPSG